MKYLIAYLLNIALVFIASFYLVNRIAGKKGMKKGRRIIASIVAALLMVSAATAILLGNYHHADETALASLKGSESVTISKTGPDYFFDGPGDDEALVFIPGGRVEETAYAPLLLKISEQGLDCFLVKVPLRVATLDTDAASRIVGQYDYESWYIGGHSLGGLAAALYASDHPEAVSGLAIMAAYPLKEVPDSISMLSIYGNLDGCLSMRSYEKYKKNWSADSTELIIKGGNHSNFGNYGLQRGDKEAAISAGKQQAKSAEAIVNWALKGQV